MNALTLFAVVFLLASATPPDEPPVEERTADDIRRELDRDDPTTPRIPAPPSVEASPVAEIDLARPPRGTLLPEGSYILSRRGRFVHSRDLGVTQFHLDPGPDDPPDRVRALTLMPSRITERIESNLAEHPATGPVEVSGRIFVYDGRNYLMPSVNPLRTSAVTTQPAQGLVREGTHLVARTGRISRSDTGGEWLLTFDSDRTARQDPPMFLLPCRLTERIIRLAQSEGDAARVIISGQVYVYHDANYLLPMVMLRPRPTTAQINP
jgi:hypothetical protein